MNDDCKVNFTKWKFKNAIKFGTFPVRLLDNNYGTVCGPTFIVITIKKNPVSDRIPNVFRKRIDEAIENKIKTTGTKYPITQRNGVKNTSYLLIFFEIFRFKIVSEPKNVLVLH